MILFFFVVKKVFKSIFLNLFLFWIQNETFSVVTNIPTKKGFLYII